MSVVGRRPWIGKRTAAQRVAVAASLVAALAVTPGCRDAPPPTVSEGVAQWRGGSLGFESLETEARSTLDRTVAMEGVDGILGHYRRTAREAALVAIMRAEEGAVEGVLEANRALVWALETQATAQAFAVSRLPRVQVTDAEIERAYAEHPEKYRSPGRRSVVHIFKRNRPGADALDVLAALRERVLAGERFEDLMDASESEVRLLDGWLGWVGRGALPGPLEDVVFGLDVGEVSQPVPVKGGGVLFLVKDAEKAGPMPLAQVRSGIREALIEEARARSIAEQTADLDVEYRVVPDDQVASRLAAVGPDDVLIATPDFELTAVGFQQILTERFETSGQPQDFVEVYRQLARQTRLRLKAEAEGFPSTADEKARLDKLLQTRRDSAVERKLLERAIRKRAERGDALRQFFGRQENRYRSPLALRLRMLRIAETSGAPEKMVRLEEVHRSWESGGESVDLASVAASLGGEVVELGWLDFSALDSLPKKVRIYVFDVDGTGLTIPFQQDGALNMIEIVERREPGPLSFEQAKPLVVRDYLTRHGQDLYQEILEERLAEGDFRFDDEAVRARLDVTPSPAPSAAANEHDAARSRSQARQKDLR
ncbi:MAG: peptidylprolyl isomerase [Acidobacteriota bacterium]